MIVFGNMDIINYLDIYCEKAEQCGIKVCNVDIRQETITFTIPVIRGDVEAQDGGLEPWIATVKLEYSVDEDWVILHRFPENLLDDEDYNFLCEVIMDELLD